MAGTLVSSVISDGVNSTSTTNAIQGSAKAWVRFNGVPATPTISGSYNVASVTKLGTGRYTVNMTNAMPDANYSSPCMSTAWITALGSSTSASSFNVECFSNTFTANDVGLICAAVFR